MLACGALAPYPHVTRWVSSLIRTSGVLMCNIAWTKGAGKHGESGRQLNPRRGTQENLSAAKSGCAG